MLMVSGKVGMTMLLKLLDSVNMKNINIESKYDSIYNESMKYYNYLKELNNEFVIKIMVSAKMDEMAYCLAIVYILFLIKEAFAIVLWFFFALFYIISFLLIMCLKQGLIMKKIIFSILICTLLSCQENSLMEINTNLKLTQNNFLLGNLKRKSSSYRVSFYDINIDFDIKKKS